MISTKYILLFNCDHSTGNFDGTKQLRCSIEPTARAKYFHLCNCMSNGSEKVVSILDIHLPELELQLEKAYFCRTRT